MCPCVSVLWPPVRLPLGVSDRPMCLSLKTPALARGNPFGVLSAHMCGEKMRGLSFEVSVVTARCSSKDLIILITTPTLVHVPLGCIPPSSIVSHLPGPCMCVRGCVPLCLCLPLCGGRSCVVARDTHACVGHAQRHTRPLVCPPRPLSSLPYLLTTSNPAPSPPTSPSLSGLFPSTPAQSALLSPAAPCPP